MKFGIFLGPFHRVGENPTLALDRDIELLQWLDHLGFDEAWIGEHHSAGWETIASPEVFIANVAERTRHIKLGTGVMSLPYHQPLMATNRMVLLDHLTRGRAMMGVGPGILLSDARMLGIDPTVQRRRLDEALGAIMQLLKGPEPVNVETDWFTLVDAVPHLAPYTKPHFPVAVASSLSPTGATLAGKYGVNLLSNVTVGTTFPDLARHWQVAEETASSHGNRMDREEWRLLQIVHLAETHKEAMDQARTGPGERISSANIWSGRSGGDPVFDGPPDKIIDHMVAEGLWCIGTPDDLVTQIRRLDAQSGGFELLARYVMPQFQGSLGNPQASQSVAEAHKQEFIDQRTRAVEKAGGEIARGS